MMSLILVRLAAIHVRTQTEVFVQDSGERGGGQDSCYWLDSTKIKALGWAQEIDWDRGLADTAAWVSAYRDELAACNDQFQMRA